MHDAPDSNQPDSSGHHYVPYESPPPRSRWHIGIELTCYAMAFLIPMALRPFVHGALPNEEWRIGAMAAIGVTLFATGICVRVRWPLAWVPGCALTCISAVLTSPWHVLTVSVVELESLVLFATQAWPELDHRFRPKRRGDLGFSALLLCATFITAGFGILRMSIVAGFPLSLAQALSTPRCALIYLRDNPHALSERNPEDLPWALYAAKNADPLVLEAVLAAGAPLDSYDWAGIGAPLDWYAENASADDPFLNDKARLLRRYGAPAGGAARAAKRGLSPLAKTLIEMGDDVNALDQFGASALGNLIESNSVAAVGCLLSNGALLRPAYGDLARARRIKVPSAAMWELLDSYGQLQPSRVSRQGF